MGKHDGTARHDEEDAEQHDRQQPTQGVDSQHGEEAAPAPGLVEPKQLSAGGQQQSTDQDQQRILDPLRVG